MQMNTDPQHQALHCVRCDYDLRAIRIEGVCPECALPLAVSTGDAAGIRLDREWLDALQGSQRWFARVFPVVVISSGVLAFGLWWGGPILRSIAICLRFDRGFHVRGIRRGSVPIYARKLLALAFDR